ncbi:heme-degrading domain-containing protein [Consotaella aegiceratis]|uniref:heme-degrading domain-containing protein n=1 Tax=Consotaella aegiceratis TaxID=3097961 RepID=UPI002F41F779
MTPENRAALERDLAAIARQEQELQFSRFDEETAWELGTRLRDLGTGLPIAIDVRRFGQPLFFTALAGTKPDNLEWVRRKSAVVARFYRSSYAVGLDLQRTGSTLAARYGIADADYAAHGGAFPIRVASAGIVGCVTVSGLKQRDDHAIVVRALAEHLDIALDTVALPEG